MSSHSPTTKSIVIGLIIIAVVIFSGGVLVGTLI